MSEGKKINALAYCVEVLCNFAMCDTTGAINTALKSDSRVWDKLGETCQKTLEDYGYSRDMFVKEPRSKQ